MTRLRYVMLALVIIAGGTAWGMIITHRDYDYDEVLRAHSSWMTSQGLRPYTDFFECHPPYFALLAPLTKGITDPVALLVTLRLVATAGNLLFLAGLASLAAMSGYPGRFVAILGTVLVAFHPACLLFLAEFRIDGWGYALTVWSIVWLLCSRRTWRHLVFGLGTGIATLLFCPKLALLAPMILVFEQVKVRSPFRNMLVSFGTYALGVGMAGALFWLWLMLNKINVNMLFACLVIYNSSYNSHSGFGHGLLRTITQIWTLSVPLLAAFVVWTIQCLRARSFPAAYPPALILWLFTQAIMVSYPHKQYYAPWFLLASCLFPSLYAVLKTCPKAIATAVFYGLCALSIETSGFMAYNWANSHESQEKGKILRLMNKITRPEDRIVAPPPLNPIYRRDTFYVWFKTHDPAGYETEETNDGIQLLHDFVSEQHYRAELEANPPAIVVLGPDRHAKRQQVLLDRFIQERGYFRLWLGGVKIAVSPECYQRLVQDQASD